MDQLEREVLNEIREHGLIRPGSHVIAAVSGGADSVCCLRILYALRGEIPLRLSVVHVEHGLRGEDSEADARFVADLCRDLEIPCRVVHVDVMAEAASGKSVEEAARILRYRCLEQIRQEQHADCIAAAHHAQDQAETVLFHLARGSGVRGAGGMRRISGAVVRPLLGISPEQIRDYLDRIGQCWREDATNASDLYARNRIRRRILPELAGINARAVEHICETADLLQRAEDFIAGCAGELADRAVTWGEDNRSAVIDLHAENGADRLLKEYVLREVIGTLRGGTGLKDLALVHIRDVLSLEISPCGKEITLPGGLRAVRERASVRIERILPGTGEETEGSGKREGDDPLADVPEAGPALWVTLTGQAQSMTVRSAAGFGGHPVRIGVRPRQDGGTPAENSGMSQKKYTKILAYDTMNGELCLRTRRQGDYLVINAEGGRKKLKDYMIDEKIPARVREQVLLLAQGSYVLCVIGWRISESAKVTPGCGKSLEITAEEM